MTQQYRYSLLDTNRPHTRVSDAGRMREGAACSAAGVRKPPRKLTSTLPRDSVTTAGQLQRQASPGLQLPCAPPRADLETGSPLGGRPPLDTNIRQCLEYSRCAFQAGDRTCAFEGSYQCGCGRRCARGSETAPPKMLRNYLGRINKSARYPFGQISVECRKLIRQILH